MTNKYGPQTYRVEMMLDRIKTLTPDEITRLCAARSGISPSVWLASWLPAYEAAQRASLDEMNAARGPDERAQYVSLDEENAAWDAWVADTDAEQNLNNADWLTEQDRKAGMPAGYHAALYAAENEAWDGSWNGSVWDESWHEAWNVWNAAHKAWNAAGNVGLPPGWPVDWLEAQATAQDTVRSAMSAVYAKHLIGKHSFTLEHYNMQTKPWRDVIGEFE